MQTPPVPTMVQVGPWIMNANAAYYLLGLPLGLLLSIPVYMVYEQRFAPKATPEAQPVDEKAKEEVPPVPETTPAGGKKKKRKGGNSGILYIMLAFVASDLVAQLAKMAFPGIPADAVVWGALTGVSAGFFVMAVVRNKARA